MKRKVHIQLKNYEEILSMLHQASETTHKAIGIVIMANKHYSKSPYLSIIMKNKHLPDDRALSGKGSNLNEHGYRILKTVIFKKIDPYLKLEAKAKLIETEYKKGIIELENSPKYDIIYE